MSDGAENTTVESSTIVDTKEFERLSSTLELALKAYDDRAKLIAIHQSNAFDKQLECERLTALIDVKKSEIIELQKDLSRANSEIAQLIMLLNAREPTLVQKKVGSGDYEARYAQILNSTSWKITAPLRKLKRFIRKVK